jgi:hypothetical protein
LQNIVIKIGVWVYRGTYISFTEVYELVVPQLMLYVLMYFMAWIFNKFVKKGMRAMYGKLGKYGAAFVPPTY